MSDLIKALMTDARSLVRPTVRQVRGAGRAVFNDINSALGTNARVYEPLRQQWQRILRRSGRVLDALPEPTGPVVLFATGNGFGGAALTFESIVMTALRMRGANPVTMVCDKVLPACEWNRFGNHLPDPGEYGPDLTERGKLEQCRICTENADDAHGPLPVPGVRFSDFLRDDDLSRVSKLVDTLRYEEYASFKYGDISVGEHAFSSVMRATLRGTLLDDAETRWLFRRYLIGAILVADLTERVLEAVRPDRLVAVHGIYMTHGTICEIARKHGIPVVVYGTPYRINTVWLSHDDTYHRTLISEPTSRWENLEFTPEMAELVDEYLNSKRFGGRDYAAYHENAVNDRETVFSELGLDAKRPIVSLYTNVLWDAQLYYQHNAFGNMLEWLSETIQYFRGRTDLQLVIRIHPAEAKGTMPTNQPLLAEIQREFPVLPENVKVIPPESNLSSYTLAEMSIASLIYGARMGVEIAALGTPLVVAGETFNRRKGYSYDVETREQYFTLLDRIQDLPRNSPEVVERARKYAYHYYFRLMMDFPLFSVTSGVHLSNPRLEIESLEELEAGRHPALDVICDGILDATSPFLYNRLEHEARTVAAPITPGEAGEGKAERCA